MNTFSSSTGEPGNEVATSVNQLIQYNGQPVRRSMTNTDCGVCNPSLPCGSHTEIMVMTLHPNFAVFSELYFKNVMALQFQGVVHWPQMVKEVELHVFLRESMTR